jgi:hypothetical protein
LLSFTSNNKKFGVYQVKLAIASFLLVGLLFSNSVVFYKERVADYTINYFSVDSATQKTPDQGTPDQGTPDQGTPDQGTPDQGVNLKSTTFSSTDVNSSLGYRVILWSDVLDFMFSDFNILTGSGFLGVWSMDSKYGSAHSQYIDVFYRVGIIFFIWYLIITLRIFFYLFKTDKALFAGVLAVAFYGIFHETYKLSHGAFIFSFLYAFSQDYRILKNE